MTCKDYYSKHGNEHARVIPYDKAKKIFEPYYVAKEARDAEDARRGLVPQPVSDLSMSVADVIASSATGRSRKLVTFRDSERIDRPTRFSAGVPQPDQLLVPGAADSFKSLGELVQGSSAVFERAHTPMNVLSQRPLDDEDDLETLVRLHT
jgi:hypothetical protein